METVRICRQCQGLCVGLQVEALLLLRGALNVACLEAVYEDEQCVYIVMELCRGGDIIKAMKSNRSNEILVRPVKMQSRKCLNSVLTWEPDNMF